MSKKPILSNVINVLTSALAINENNEAIETAFENTISRDGSTPNQMEADLDLNSNDLLNVKDVHAERLLLDGSIFTGEGGGGTQTGAEIKVLYEGEDDTNAFTDAEKAKLASLSTGSGDADATWTLASTSFTATTGQKVAADVTSSAWTVYLPISPSDGDPVTVAVFRGDATTNNLTIDGSGKNIEAPGLTPATTFVIDMAFSFIEVAYSSSLNAWRIVKASAQPDGSVSTVLGDLDDVDVASPSDGEVLTWVNSNSAWEAVALTGYATAAQGALADSAQQPPSEGAFVNGDKTKLDGIEAGADVTDATNVTAAGALMDSEVTNLAQVKAFDETDYPATDPTGVTGADKVTNIMSLTQTEYDAIGTPNASTLYVITT